MRFTLLLVLVLFGCESGTARVVKVTLPESVASSFTTQAPGVLVSDLGSRVQPWVALCGQAPKNPLTLSQDRGFGCLGSLDGMSETVRVWVQPMPSEWDAGAVCDAFSQERSFYKAFTITTLANDPDGGVDDGGVALPAEPQPGWAQGTGESTWRRDVSPCGGVIAFEVTLAVP